MSVNNIDSIQGISAMELGSMDLETALLAVQNQRSQLLEGQLKGQIDAVQTKNDEIAKMNEGMNASQAQLGKVEAQIPVNEARIQELTAMRDQLTIAVSELYTGIRHEHWHGRTFRQFWEWFNARCIHIVAVAEADELGELEVQLLDVRAAVEAGGYMVPPDRLDAVIELET